MVGLPFMACSAWVTVGAVDIISKLGTLHGEQITPGPTSLGAVFVLAAL
jgi:hypothetical protein